MKNIKINPAKANILAGLVKVEVKNLSFNISHLKAAKVEKEEFKNFEKERSDLLEIFKILVGEKEYKEFTDLLKFLYPEE